MAKKEKTELIEEKKDETKKELIENPEKKSETDGAGKNVKENLQKKEDDKIKKTEAVVTSSNLPLSTKKSAAICKFIKNKKIERAISDLEEVIAHKKVVPMVGEIPHRRGKGIMSGRFPKKTAEYFVKLLKNLSANSIVNKLENPVITDAVANIGSRPYGRFGTIKRKRTHIQIIAKEIKQIKNK